MPTNRIAQPERPSQSFIHLPQHFTEDELTRFWWMVFKTPTCWLWEGTLNSHCYGNITVCGRLMYTHRASYMMHFGDIPDGLWVLHDCPAGDQPACLNPEHLWLGSEEDNARDAVAKGQSAAAATFKRLWATKWKDRRGENAYQHKLTDEQVLEIRRLHKEEGIGHKRLHQRFGVSYGVIQRVLNRTTWKHLP